MFVGDDPCSDVCLDEAVDDDAAPQHHAVVRLPGDEEGQAAVVAVCISSVDILGCDDDLLPLSTAEDRLQTSGQHRDLVVDGHHLEMTCESL